jgi:molecular chaperone GrpE (heat shock protein)
MADLEAVRREHYKARTASEALVTKVGEQIAQMGSLAANVASLKEAYARLETEMMSYRQSNAAQRREIDEWRSAVIEALDAASRPLSDTTIDPHIAAGIQNQLRVLEQAVSGLNLNILRPKLGDAFDGRTHEVVEQNAANGVEPGIILECRAWGYVHRGELVRRAKVVMSIGASQLAPTPERQHQAGGPPVSTEQQPTNPAG